MVLLNCCLTSGSSPIRRRRRDRSHRLQRIERLAVAAAVLRRRAAVADVVPRAAAHLPGPAARVDEDLDAEMREDILKPASTRSKIVVSLREPSWHKGAAGKLPQFKHDDDIEYVLDPYDKVRMRLLHSGEKFFTAYEQTIREIKGNVRL